VSWNGATEVRKWRLVVDGTAGAAAAKRGFETAIAVPSSAKRIAVQALDANGTTLGTSKTITTP